MTTLVYTYHPVYVWVLKIREKAHRESALLLNYPDLQGASVDAEFR